MSFAFRPQNLLSLALTLLLVSACEPEPNTVCNLEGMGCDECLDGVVECSYAGVAATEPSCQGCQAQFSLYDALCDAGFTETIEEVDDAMVCTDVTSTP